MYKNVKKILASGLVLVLALSCSKQNLKTAWSTQEDRIDSFIQSISTEADPDNPDALYAHEVVYNGGSNRVVLREGTGEALADGGTVSFYYTVKTVTLGGDDGLVTGLHNGLKGVKSGEICYILFSGQYGFGKRPVGAIPGNSALLYYIRVESVSN